MQAVPFGFSKVVILSHVIGDGAPVFPGDPPVEVRQVATIERDGYYLQSITIGEQAGASPSSGKPMRAKPDAAGRRLDHHRRTADPGRLGLSGDRVRTDPVAVRPLDFE